MKDLIPILICVGFMLTVVILVWLFVPNFAADFAAWMKFLLLA